jgi:glutamine amidotransferase PdxT
LKTVGILALQGDFDAHRKALERAGDGGARAV